LKLIGVLSQYRCQFSNFEPYFESFDEFLSINNILVNEVVDAQGSYPMKVYEGGHLFSLELACHMIWLICDCYNLELKALSPSYSLIDLFPSKFEN